MAKIGVLCVLLIMVFSCDTQEKQTKLSLVYNHNERNLRQVQETPVRHNIKVAPNIAETADRRIRFSNRVSTSPNAG